MSASSDDEDSWVPFSAREEWKDLQPIPQNDGPFPVVQIAYTPQFTDTMNYFRALVARDERSPRGLQLTAAAVEVNAANYTVWHYRRLILESLEADLEAEVRFVERQAEKNPKNYQLWHHRRWLAERRGPAGRDVELDFTAKVLEGDAKNYHAWSHRQWILQALGGWESELDFCGKLLQEDVYNNSAWNQRYFVVTRSPLLGGLASVRHSEVSFCKAAISDAPQNESSWRYLMGLYKDDKSSMVKEPQAVSTCLEELAKNKTCVHALSFLLELMCRGFQPTEADCRLIGLESDKPEQQANEVCELLKVVDSMRANYWLWRQSLIRLED